ncbi:MAG: hypothetical protein L3K52_17015 [Candidatus Thiothrix sulfatifontis]|nr:MAG: hypothetical protein L3K52_17015 [Candidatus Thiothrix sulfatifontis]
MKTLRLLFSLIALSSGATYAAESAKDTQTLSLTVPLVALIDVDTTNSASFSFEPPLNAGDGFSGIVLPVEGVTVPVAISSNNPEAKLTATLNTNQLSANGILLSAQTSGLTGTVCGQSKALINTAKTICSVGMVKTSAANITLTADTSVSGMIAYGNYTADIIYTLTQN